MIEINLYVLVNDSLVDHGDVGYYKYFLYVDHVRRERVLTYSLV